MVSLSGISKFVASGFGSGLFGTAPGTIGSIAAFLLWHLLHRLLHRLGVGQPLVVDSLLLLLAIGAGFWSVLREVAREAPLSPSPERGPKVDPQWIVIDEWSGLFVALFGIASSDLLLTLVALLLFRLFDIWKPGAVRELESLGGAAGIMADDLAAGVLARAVILLWQL